MTPIHPFHHVKQDSLNEARDDCGSKTVRVPILRKPLTTNLGGAMTKSIDEHTARRKLKGKLEGYLRVRVGDFRIIFRLDVEKRLIIVVKISRRKRAYR